MNDTSDATTPESTLPDTPVPGSSDPLRKQMLIGKIILLVLLTGYGARCVKHGWYEKPPPTAQGNAKRKRKYRGTDFTAFYSAGELARTGGNIFEYKESSTPFRPYLYLPMFAVFPMAPLSLLPHNLALSLYYLINVSLLGGSLWMLYRVLWPPGLSSNPWLRPEFGMLMAVLVCGRFLDSNMVLGQANLFILFLITLGWYWMQQGKGFRSGTSIALATTFKLTPGLFGLYFFWSFRKMAMAGGATGLIIFLLVAPALLLGFSNNWDYLNNYVAHHVSSFSKDKNAEATSTATTTKDATVTSATQTEASTEKKSSDLGWKKKIRKKNAKRHGRGISLKGTFSKLLSPVIALDKRKGQTRRSVNIVDLKLKTAVLISIVCSLILLIGTIAITFPHWANAPGFNLALSWGLIATTMLLISPMTRKAHCVVLILPVITLIAMLQQQRLKNIGKKSAWLGLCVLGGIGLLTSKEIIGSRASELTHAMGSFTWAILILYSCLFVILFQQRPARSKASTEAPAA